MSREKEAYRDNLELLLESFPNKKILCCSDIAKWAGRDIKTIKKLYFQEKQYITVAELARRMS
jgi:hypothetical protein